MPRTELDPAVRYIAFHREAAIATVAYLRTRPYNEVADLLTALDQNAGLDHAMRPLNSGGSSSQPEAESQTGSPNSR